jgi:hypothetical protein
MKVKDVYVGDAEWKDRAFGRDVVGWNVILDLGNGDRFAGTRIYRSIDSAYEAMERINYKLGRS